MKNNHSMEGGLNIIKNALRGVGGLFLLAFFVRLGFLMSSDNFYGFGPMLNIITALKAFNYFSFFENIYFCPLPFYLYSLVFSVWMGTEQIICAQFLSLLFGSLSIPIFYLFVRKNFNKLIAFYAALILCFYPAHIIMSIITSADSIGFFLLLVCLNLILNKNYFYASIILAISCGFTYLAWVFVLILNLFMFIQSDKKNIKKIIKLFFFSIISCSVPAAIIVLIKIKYCSQGLFYRNFYLADSFMRYIINYGNTVKIAIRALLMQPVSGFFLVSLIGVFFFLKQKRIKCYDLIFLFGLTLILICLGIFRDEICILGQGVNFLSIMCIPFFVFAVTSILQKFKIKKIIFVLICIFCLILFLVSTCLKPKLPEKVKELSAWLKENIDEKTKIYINKDETGYYSSIIMLSGLPQGNFKYYNSFDDFSGQVDAEDNYLILSLEQYSQAKNVPGENLIVLEGYSVYKLDN
ncbi:MAG: hypothetical protein ABIG64_08625 [Candidatus Omnitrophota bacterium]